VSSKVIILGIGIKSVRAAWLLIIDQRMALSCLNFRPSDHSVFGRSVFFSSCGKNSGQIESPQQAPHKPRSVSPTSDKFSDFVHEGPKNY
jgi:hypothetical protein